MKIKLFFRVKAILQHHKDGEETIIGQKYLINYNPEEYIETHVDAKHCTFYSNGAIGVSMDFFNFLS